MPGKFTDTRYTERVDSLVKATKGLLRNPYYIYNDKPPTKVIYYKQNIERTTLDPASGLNYTHIGEQSPMKFNKIEDFILYGIEEIPLAAGPGDWGLESDPIEGTAVCLPNTIIPTIGDFFAIPYINEDILFKINNVDQDTLDTGAQVYSLSYKLELIDKRPEIEAQVVKTYKCIVNNIGSNFKSVIESSTYDLIGTLEDTIDRLIDAAQFFFDPKVQTYVFLLNGMHMYDPYLIEFLKRNKIMSSGSKYHFVEHACALPRTFAYEYSRTLFYILEHPEELKTRKFSTVATANVIKDFNSLFSTRIEKFYLIDYNGTGIGTRIEPLDGKVLDHLTSGELFAETDDVNLQVYNLVIAYLHGKFDYIKGNLLEMLRQLEFSGNREYFYLIPINIFVIRQYITHLMKLEEAM